MNFLWSLLLDVSKMLPPERSPCKMFMLCRYARALAISRAVSLGHIEILLAKVLEIALLPYNLKQSRLMPASQARQTNRLVWPAKTQQAGRLLRHDTLIWG